VSTQTLLAGGDYAVAMLWGTGSSGGSADSASSGSGTTATTDVLYLSIANDVPLATSAATAVAVVKAMGGEGAAALFAGHANWWASWWPRSFVSIAQSEQPDPDLATETETERQHWRPGDHSTGTSSPPAATPAVLSTALEGFYWIQMYKLASSTRAEGPALDLMG
jgi:hypothetical protein